MPEPKSKETLDTARDQIKQWVAQGNQRHVIFRKADGEKFAEFSLTVVAIMAAIFLFFTFPWGWTLALVAAIFGTMAKIRIEVVRDLTGDDNTLQVDPDE